MNTTIRRILVVLLIGTFSLSLAACNTMRGVGKDTEKAGEKIQEEAEEHMPAKDKQN